MTSCANNCSSVVVVVKGDGEEEDEHEEMPWILINRAYKTRYGFFLSNSFFLSPSSSFVWSLSTAAWIYPLFSKTKEKKWKELGFFSSSPRRMRFRQLAIFDPVPSAQRDPAGHSRSPAEVSDWDFYILTVAQSCLAPDDCSRTDCTDARTYAHVWHFMCFLLFSHEYDWIA